MSISTLDSEVPQVNLRWASESQDATGPPLAGLKPGNALLWTFCTYLWNLYITISALIHVEADHYAALGFSERANLLQTYYPSWFGTADVLEQVWFWGELVVLLFNRRKRAIHDFIAGTVVIHKKFAEQVGAPDRR